jgi:hypothetical protein
MEKQPPSPPKPSKIVRKLKLSREVVAPLTRDVVDAPGCTKRWTGCPIHTC